MDKSASAFLVALILFSFSQFLPKGVQAEDVDKGECLTTASDGAIILGHEVGTFRSEDKGATWEHFSYKFGRRLSPAETTTLNCPRLIEHPQYGLVRMAGTKLKE